MSMHIFANIATPFGTAANNRGETDGNVTTLQKLVWHGEVHTTVSAEAIRFALRRLLAKSESGGSNRAWNENERVNQWQDPEFKGWDKPTGETYIDDDLLGFMSAKAAASEGESGSANVRRAVLEVSRAVSLTPWSGDVTFNAASPGATPSAQKKGSNPVPYGTEVHATRYQFGFAITPERLRQPARALIALRSLISLRTVAGNHGRFFYDFAPDSIVLRITDDPAPRCLYCFDTTDGGKTVHSEPLLQRVSAGDILAKELIVGGAIAGTPNGKSLCDAKVTVVDGVKAAIEKACERLNDQLSAAR
jgi:CRISPR-associated protein Cst2